MSLVNPENPVILSKGLRLKADGMFFRVGVGAVRGDEVADPAERAAGSKPESRRENQPQNSRQDTAVVKLPHSGNNQTQNAC